MNDIVLSRRLLSDFDQLVKRWTAGWGEQNRKVHVEARPNKS